MIQISEEVDIAAPASEVWAILNDPATVVRCVPGATLIREVSPGVYEAGMSIKFGPTIAKFTGEAEVAYDDAARRCTLSGRGNDKRGASPTKGSGVITVEGGDTTRLKIDGTVEMSGPLEPFLSTGGVVVARTLFGEFAKNITQLMQERGGDAASQPAPGAEAAPAPAPVPLSAGKLFGQILAERWRALMNRFFGRKEKNG